MQVLAARHGRPDARPAHPLADLCGGREARAADRHPRRQHLSARADASGWPSYRVEDYIAQSSAFENQLVSFVTEGVFQKFPKLKLVLIESGFTWLPPLLWRTGKLWRGVRPEVPWLDRSPAEIIRDHVRLTLQPIDAPDAETARAHARAHRFRPDAAVLDRLSRTGSSTATTCCPKGCRTKPCAGS